MIPANDAYIKTIEARNKSLIVDRTRIESKIQNAIEKGLFECTVEKIPEEIEAELLSNGYDVKKFVPYNLQFEDPCITISWEKFVQPNNCDTLRKEKRDE